MKMQCIPGFISAIAGITAAAIKSTFALIELIKAIYDAPKFVDELRGQLATLAIVVVEAGEVFPSANLNNKKMVDPTKFAIHSCVQVLEEIAGLLKALQCLRSDHRGMKASRRIHTVIKVHELNETVKKLEPLKTILVIALVAVVASCASIEPIYINTLHLRVRG
ncbi:hypothetical protein BDD12DRAFT_810981 [Trichophaea hybrida]|nr:hypothetical protein BDD12DRAFT_810981 [Trichophaea hybrida]